MGIEEKLILNIIKNSYPFVIGIDIQEYQEIKKIDIKNIDIKKIDVDILWPQFKEYYKLKYNKEFEKTMEIMGGSITTTPLNLSSIYVDNKDLYKDISSIILDIYQVASRMYKSMYPNKIIVSAIRYFNLKEI